jgi:ATP-dependent exoDNAse (exonuclease V) beta subunit
MQVTPTAAELSGRVIDMVAQAFRAAVASTPKLVGDNAIQACQPFHPPVRAWVDGGMNGPPPCELVPWCGGRTKKSDTSSTAQTLRGELAQHRLDLGIVQVGLDSLVPKLVQGFSNEGIRTCDALRSDLLALAQKARAHAFRMAAQVGALDHDLLTEAAIDLCSRDDRSIRLRNRFEALLVDEVQDSSPRQFRLYQALEQLPGSGRTLRVFHVGDARQSIYLFRGAEPAGLAELVKRADSGGGSREDLDQNFRSTPAMVDAQKALFARATNGTETLPGLPGVASVDQVKSSPGKKKHELSSEVHYPLPVVMVNLGDLPEGKKMWSAWDYNCAAIDVFAQRIQDAWDLEKRPDDTAAVLTASWPKAIAARDRLRAILRKAKTGDAFLDGSRELAKRQVAQDVRTLVRSLWDSTDDIAWVGLWRHPMIGLSDGALAALHTGTGLLPQDSKRRGLAGALAADALSPEVFSEIDVDLFQRVRPILVRARRDIGRIPTADVIERLAADLHWRPILLAGPDAMDSVGELEVILDWIRQAEADQIDPDAVVAMLDPAQAEEPPRVELYRGARTVSCTTVHQAKGLKYDHVLVYDIGTSPSGNSDDGWSRATVSVDGMPRTLLGVKFDPNGALKPVPDLVHRLADMVDDIRRDEERLRLAYVAVTRAVRSVTFAIGTAKAGIHEELANLWTAEPPMTGVYPHTAQGPAEVDAVRKGYAQAISDFPVPPVEPAGWSSVSPSRAMGAWKDQDSAALDTLVADIAARCEFRKGDKLLNPPRLAGETADREVESTDWGTLVHAWMEFGGLDAGADLALAVRFLSDKYSMVHPDLAQWLLDMVHQLEQTQPDLVAMLRSSEPTLHFEMPFAGVNNTFPTAPWFHAGRMDLLVTWPGRRAWVIDFKAGHKSPTSREDLVKGASLAEYVPQLEAYRSALTAAGWTVEKVGILFVRTGAWLAW